MRIFVRLCSKHRKSLSIIPDSSYMINDAESVSANSQYTTGAHSYTMRDQRDTVNRILAEVHLSPIKSQTTISLKRQSKSGLRRLVSKLTQGTRVLQSIFIRLKNMMTTYSLKFRETS